jgi:DNA-binding HxlR family transcriptional regulator
MKTPPIQVKSAITGLHRQGALEVLYALQDEPLNYSRVPIRNERQRILILRDLLAVGLINKRDQPTIPMTTLYSISTLGQALLKAFMDFDNEYQNILEKESNSSS